MEEVAGWKRLICRWKSLWASSRNKGEDMEKDIRGTCLGLYFQRKKRGKSWWPSVTVKVWLFVSPTRKWLVHTFPISLTEILILCFKQQKKEIVAFGYKTVTHPKTQHLQKVECPGLIRRCWNCHHEDQSQSYRKSVSYCLQKTETAGCITKHNKRVFFNTYWNYQTT